MRSFIVMAMFAASLAHADWDQYRETRELSLDAAGISELDVDAGAGSLRISGDDGATAIQVTALVQVDEDDEDKAQKIIRERMRLSLEEQGDTAKLISHFESGFMGDGGGAIALEIVMPATLALNVDDGSGSIKIRAGQRRQCHRRLGFHHHR